MERRFRQKLAVLGVLLSTGVQGAVLLERGTPLSEALHRLSERFAVNIIFSSTVVGPDLIVLHQTGSSDVRGMLTELLEPHKLQCRWQAGDCVVVRSPRSSEAVTPQDAPRGPEKSVSNQPAPTLMEPVLARPGAYALMGTEGQYLSREAIERIPHFSDDVYRMLRTLPGIAGSDFGAPLNVRGGRTDEVQVLLDGVELIRPFHLQNLQNGLSILDPNIISGIDFYAGSWPARFGGRMSAVMDVQTFDPDPGHTQSIGISGINAHYNVAAADEAGRHRVLAALRPGYLSYLLRFVDVGGELDPQYLDAYLKYSFSPNEAHRLSLHVLQTWDDIVFEGNDPRDRSDGDTDVNKLWLRWQWQLNDVLSHESLLSVQRQDLGRIAGEVDLDGGSVAVRDQRDVRDWMLAHRWRGETTHGRFELGLEYRRDTTDFDYSVRNTRFNPFGPTPQVFRVETFSETSRRASVYWDHELGLGAPWSVRYGIRGERLQDAAVDDVDWLPSALFSYAVSDHLVLGLAYAKQWQNQRSDEIQIEDGLRTPFAPETAHQWALSAEARGESMRWRLEWFDKRYRNPRASFENIFDPYELVPEANNDRVLVAPERARSRGAELSFDLDGTHTQWFGSVVYSRARETIGGAVVPRSWDQPWAVNLGFARSLWQDMAFTMQLNYRRGWPFTPVSAATDTNGRLRLSLGPRNSQRFDDYVNLSARLSKTYQRRAGSELSFYLEAYNLLGRSNPMGINRLRVAQTPSGPEVGYELQEGLPRIPSFGVDYRF